MIKYTNGDGSSQANAIKIVGAGNTKEGIMAEYELIGKYLRQELIYDGENLTIALF
jgi:hypothetical protein